MRRCCRTVETPPWQQVTIGYNTVSSRQKTTALHACGVKSESRGYYTILSKLSLWAPLSSPQMLKTNEILEAFIVALKWMISAPRYILYSIQTRPLLLTSSHHLSDMYIVRPCCLSWVTDSECYTAKKATSSFENKVDFSDLFASQLKASANHVVQNRRHVNTHDNGRLVEAALRDKIQEMFFFFCVQRLTQHRLT